MKHAAEPKHKISKKIFIVLAILVIIFIIFVALSKDKENSFMSGIIEKTTTSSKEKDNKVVNQITFKSTNTKVCERQITYSFNKKDIIVEIKTIEKFLESKDYEEYKEKYAQRVDIEVLETLDEDLTIIYHKVDFSVDEGLNYEQIKEKYMSIPGAYEIVEN